MGRLKCNTVLPCQGTHFTFDERTRLQHYLLNVKFHYPTKIVQEPFYKEMLVHDGTRGYTRDRRYTTD